MTRVARRAGRTAALVLAWTPLATLLGCAHDGALRPQELPRIDGLSALQYDGYRLLLRSSLDDPERMLFVSGRAAAEALVAVGGEFSIAHGRAELRTYRVLSADDDAIVLHETQTTDRRAEREGLLRRQRVLRVRPYDLRAPTSEPAAESSGRRGAFRAAACGADDVLRHEVESLWARTTPPARINARARSTC